MTFVCGSSTARKQRGLIEISGVFGLHHNCNFKCLMANSEHTVNGVLCQMHMYIGVCTRRSSSGRRGRLFLCQNVWSHGLNMKSGGISVENTIVYIKAEYQNCVYIMMQRVYSHWLGLFVLN